MLTADQIAFYHDNGYLLVEGLLQSGPRPAQALAVYDRPSALLRLVYVAWVLGYDVPWTHAHWKLHPSPQSWPWPRPGRPES